MFLNCSKRTTVENAENFNKMRPGNWLYMPREIVGDINKLWVIITV